MIIFLSKSCPCLFGELQRSAERILMREKNKKKKSTYAMIARAQVNRSGEEATSLRKFNERALRQHCGANRLVCDCQVNTLHSDVRSSADTVGYGGRILVG